MPTKVLLTKPTHDCHDRGIRSLARHLRDAGFEVIFTNFLLPEEIVAVAVQEDVDVIGVSSSSGGHLPVFETLLAALPAAGLGDVLVIGGGTIPPGDAATLRRWGVAEIFGAGSTPAQAIEFIRARLARPVPAAGGNR